MKDAFAPLLAELSEPDDAVVAAIAALEGPLLLLGAGGKMGHGLALMAHRAVQAANTGPRVIAVSRFSSAGSRKAFEDDGIETIACDVGDADQVAKLPEAANVIFMVGQKFGTADNPGATWVANTYVPAIAAMRFKGARIAAYSSGNVYPFTSIAGNGPTEADAVGPVGEYAQSVLGRERVLQYFSQANGTPVVVLRLNYANEPRYGVLVDIAVKLLAGEPIDLTMGYVNLIWQSDCNRVTLRCLPLATSPAALLNLAGPQKLAVREIAEKLAAALGVAAKFTGQEGDTALLADASYCWKTFGPPHLDVDRMIHAVAAYLKAGGQTFNKPTHFEVRNGTF